MKTTRYKTCSTHTIGISWHLNAPEGLTEDDVEKFVEAICNFTDEPSDYARDEILSNPCYNEDLDEGKTELFKQITFHTDCVHREAYVDVIEKE